MTLSTSTASQTFPGNGVTQIFPCGFRIFQAADISVSLVDAVTGISTPLALNSDYTLTGEGDQTGFTLSTSVPVAPGTNLLVARNIPYTQPTDFTNQGSFFPTMHEDCADRLGMQIQQLAGSIQRTLQLPDGIYPVASGTLPYPSPLAPIVWNAAGNGLENGSTSMTGDLLLRGNLSSTSSGNGAALVGFKAGGTGAVPRTVQAKLGDIVNVLDYGAVGDGVTDDAPAFQRAINALGAGGGTVVVPQRNYAWATKVVANAGVLLRGDSPHDNSASTNGSASALPRIFWTGATDTSLAGVMFKIKPATVGNVIFGGGSTGIVWSGQSIIGYAVRFDNCVDTRFNGRIDQVVSAGLDICSDSGAAGNFSQHNVVERLTYIYGAGTATQNSTGLLLRGNGSTIPGTQHFIGPCTGLVKNGWMVQVQECDNCTFEFISGVSTGTGGSLSLLNVGAQGASNNVIRYVTGKVSVDNGLVGNHFLNFNGEGGSLVQAAGTSSWHANLLDYVGGKMYESHRVQLRKKINIPAGLMVPDAVSGTLQLASQWVGAKLPESATSSLTATIPPDYDIESGSITAVELRVSSNGTSLGNLRLQVVMSALADGNKTAVVTPEVTQAFTVAAPAQYTLGVTTLTLTTPLAVAAGDNILFKIVRLPADALDTNTDDCIVLSARLLFVGDGPTAGGSGPWAIPTW